jgi:hypothetical protein
MITSFFPINISTNQLQLIRTAAVMDPLADMISYSCKQNRNWYKTVSFWAEDKGLKVLPVYIATCVIAELKVLQLPRTKFSMNQ